MDYLYMLLKFIVGGSVIVGVSLLAEQVDPRYGGMLAAAPIITTLAFLFTYSEAGRETTRQLVISAFYFAIPSLMFLLAFWFLMYRFTLLMSLGGAYGIWIGAVLVITGLLPVGDAEIIKTLKFIFLKKDHSISEGCKDLRHSGDQFISGRGGFTFTFPTLKVISLSSRQQM
jgi:uncharacterized membrane protein (GlpM family)